MQYVGFQSKATVREYTFTAREPSFEGREFIITIDQEAFTARRVSFQDAPDVCSLKLRRELATSENFPLQSTFHITDAELEEYRSSHGARKKNFLSRKPIVQIPQEPGARRTW